LNEGQQNRLFKHREKEWQLMENKEFCREEPYHVVVRNHVFDLIMKERDFGFYSLQDAIEKFIELIVSPSAINQMLYNRNDDPGFWECDDEEEFQYVDVTVYIGVFRALQPIKYEFSEYEPTTGFMYSSCIYDIYDYQPPYNTHLADKLFEINTAYTLEPDGTSLSHEEAFSSLEKKRAVSEIYKSGNYTTNPDALDIIKGATCLVDCSNIEEVSKVTNQIRPCARPYRNDYGFLIEYVSSSGVSSVQYGKEFRWPLYAIRPINLNKLAQVEDAIKNHEFSFQMLQGEDIYDFILSYRGRISSGHLLQCFENALPILKESIGDWVYCLDNTQEVHHHYQFAFNLFQTEEEMADLFFKQYCNKCTSWADLSISQRKEYLLRIDSDFSRFPTVIFDHYSRERVLGYTSSGGGYYWLYDFLPGY